MKKAKFYWKLNQEYSVKYYSHIRFEKKLNSLYTEPKSQMSLRLPKFTKLTDVSFLRNMHAIDFSGSHKLSGVNALGGVHTLNLRNCIGVADNPHNVIINDGVRQYTGPIDITTLGNVVQLNLSYCDGVRDVSFLGNVYDLNLSYCINLVDVWALGNVHTLNLRNCPSVQNVSALINVHTLDLCNCNGIKDISDLVSVRILKLSRGMNVIGADKLSNVNIIYES
jgi:hypothetical protein